MKVLLTTLLCANLFASSDTTIVNDSIIENDTTVNSENSISSSENQYVSKEAFDSVVKSLENRPILVVSPISNNTSSTEDIDEENIKELTEYAAAQLHYCMSLVYGLEREEDQYGNYTTPDISIDYLKNKLNEIDENLRMAEVEQKLPAIGDFRQKIRPIFNELIQQKKDEEVYYSLLALKKKNEKLNSLNKALASPMGVFSGGAAGAGQVIFNVVLTAARTGVDMAVSKNTQKMEDLSAQHEFEKRRNTQINKAGEELYDLRRKLYQNIKIGLKDEHSLTRDDLKLFSRIIGKTGRKKITGLRDNKEKFSILPDYYYHLGMAYMELEMPSFDDAKIYFDEYLRRFDNEKSIFRIDERIGLIALTKITYEDLSGSELDDMVTKMLKHLPNNEMAYWVAAMKYCGLKEYHTGFTKLREGISNLETCGCEVLVHTALECADKIIECADDMLIQEMYDAIIDSKNLSVQDYIRCELCFGDKNRLPLNLLKIDIAQKKLYKEDLPHEYTIVNDLTITLNNSYNYTLPYDSIRIYSESVKGSDLVIWGYDIKDEHLKKSEIEERFPKLKGNEKDFIMFFEYVDKRKDICRVRRDFKKEDYKYGRDKYNAIVKGADPEMQSEDVNEVVEFCETQSQTINKVIASISNNYEMYAYYMEVKKKKEADYYGLTKDIGDGFYRKDPLSEIDSRQTLELARREYTEGITRRWRKTEGKWHWSQEDEGAYRYYGTNINYIPYSNEFDGEYLRVVIGESKSTQVQLTYQIEGNPVLKSIVTPEGYYNMR